MEDKVLDFIVLDFITVGQAAHFDKVYKNLSGGNSDAYVDAKQRSLRIRGGCHYCNKNGIMVVGRMNTKTGVPFWEVSYDVLGSKMTFINISPDSFFEV